METNCVCGHEETEHDEFNECTYVFNEHYGEEQGEECCYCEKYQ